MFDIAEKNLKVDKSEEADIPSLRLRNSCSRPAETGNFCKQADYKAKLPQAFIVLTIRG